MSAVAIRNLLFILLLWGSFFFAIAKGGRSERAVALIMLIGIEVSHFALSPMSTRYHGIEIGVLVADLLIFLGLFAVVLVTRKFWPFWVAGMQGVTLMTHLSGVLPDVIPNAYANAAQLWSWPILITLAVATWLHMRQRRRDHHPAVAAHWPTA